MTKDELLSMHHKDAIAYLNGKLEAGESLDDILAELDMKIAELTKSGLLYIKGRGFKSLTWSESDMTKSYFDMDE